MSEWREEFASYYFRITSVFAPCTGRLQLLSRRPRGPNVKKFFVNDITEGCRYMTTYSAPGDEVVGDVTIIYFNGHMEQRPASQKDIQNLAIPDDLWAYGWYWDGLGNYYSSP